MGNQTVLPRRISQPPLPQRGKNEGETFTNVHGYLGKQRELIDRLWELLVRSISEHHGAGPLANRPSPGLKNRTYLVTDAAPNLLLSVDDGTTWRNITLP